jgi:hypothetical protein
MDIPVEVGPAKRKSHPALVQLWRQERGVRNLDTLRSCPVKQAMCLKATLPAFDGRSANLWRKFNVFVCAPVIWQLPGRAGGVFNNLTELCEVYDAQR